eukprot:scaffold163553_cov29-Tisochrysis_lutea.AAC.3
MGEEPPTLQARLMACQVGAQSTADPFIPLPTVSQRGFARCVEGSRVATSRWLTRWRRPGQR